MAARLSDRVNYFETLAASDENLEFAIDLEADRMVNSYIKGEDLASEMTVVRNEFERGENSPAGVLDKLRHRHGLQLAQLRQADHRKPQRHRARAGGEFAGVLQKVLPAGQCRAGGRRQI